MKVKRILLMAFLAVVFAACAPTAEGSQTSIAVQVPAAINLAIEVGLTTLMTAGAVWLMSKVGLDLRGFAIPLSIVISGFVVGELQDVINTIPEQFDFWLNILFQVIVMVLGIVGAFALRKPPRDEGLL